MVKRGKLEIMRDILKLVREKNNSIKPTPLSRKSGLSSIRFREYRDELIERKLIKEIVDEDKEKFIILTEKGFKFLERYKAIIDFIDEFDL